MFEYGLALPIHHSSLAHKKLETSEFPFLVLYVFTILGLHFLFVKIQRIFVLLKNR